MASALQADTCWQSNSARHYLCSTSRQPITETTYNPTLCHTIHMDWQACIQCIIYTACNCMPSGAWLSVQPASNADLKLHF